MTIMWLQRKRILLKLSGEALSGTTGEVYDYDKLSSLLQKVSDLAHKADLAIVLGGGNIRRYRDNINTNIERVTSDYIWMTATIINAIVISEKMAQLGHEVAVYSPGNMQIPNCTWVYNVHTVREDMAAGKIVFCAWGTWNPYATTDSAAICRALELKCDLVIKATKVDGIYSKDPLRFADAVKYDTMTLEEAAQKQVNIMDHPAIALAVDEKLPLRVCKLEEIDACWKTWVWTWVLPESLKENTFNFS